jgi:DNA repair protein RadD
MTPRPYQQAAHDAVIEWVRRNTAPCLIDAPTGSGKSHIVAHIAETLHRISGGKHILVLCPQKELVEQNHEKFMQQTGHPASIYSASVGQKCLQWPVVFGTPGTVKAVAERIAEHFCAIIIDEAHGLTPTVMGIIDKMQKNNPRLRVIGLTATPYRLGSGYIFSQWPDGKPVPEGTARDPYFLRCVYRIHAHELIAQGYLTPPVNGAIGGERYETMHMQTNNMGKFDSSEIDRAFVGRGRKTSAIIADVVERSRGRAAVMIFAATIQHAKECIDSLPPEISVLVTGDLPKRQREKIINDIKSQRYKYIVNVAVLTTGFDAPHIDTIALLRATESVGLLQQIVGRGLRIAPEKTECLILDYAENIERHCPDGDIFNPKIKAHRTGTSEHVPAICPLCATENEFSARPNEEGFDIDKNGYFVDLEGLRVPCEFGEGIPAHFGRRCMGVHRYAGGEWDRCSYRWTGKECPDCGADNDIAARYCNKCKSEIVDPNEKLRIEFRALKRDPIQMQTDTVSVLETIDTLSRSGNECLRVDIVTPHRRFSVWFVKDSDKKFLQKKYQTFLEYHAHGIQSVTYKKEQNGMYNIYAYNLETDEEKAGIT